MATLKEFEEFRDGLEKEAKALYAHKNREYAKPGDCFLNFRQIALDMGVSPEKVAMIYACKHWRSIQEAILSGRYTGQYFGRVEDLRSRFMDIINYLHAMAYLCDESMREYDEKIRASA